MALPTSYTVALSRPWPISRPMTMEEVAATAKMATEQMSSMLPARALAARISVEPAMWPMMTLYMEVPRPHSVSLHTTGLE